MRKEIIIFDLDGTLVDAYKAVASSLNFALKKTGFPAVDPAAIKRGVGWGDKNLIRRFVPLEYLDEALLIYRRHHKKALKTAKFLPGAKRVLGSLKKRGFRLAIASNRPALFTKIILKNLKIAPLFDVVLCADKVNRPKPAPDILREILKKFSVNPGAALYIGDMTIDVQTGKKAGVRTIAVLTGSSTRKEIAALKPFKIVNNIREILGITRS